ncbi:MAG: hypothetical protein ACI84R_001085 [Candidatus Azotimanducaceae bacterium]|jgi:hypothetical protein
MLLRTGLILALSLPLFACVETPPISLSQDEIWKGIEACKGKEVCSISNLVAAEMNKQVGRNFGNGVKLRGAKSDGETVTLGVDVPAKIVNEPVKSGQSVEQYLGNAFRDGMCKQNKDVRRFLSLGGKVRLVTYLPSGKKFSDSVLKSC